MGGGKFGRNALRYFKTLGAKVIIVDKNSNCLVSKEVDFQTTKFDFLNRLDKGNSVFLLGDALQILANLLEIKIPDLIVTAIPCNTIAEFVKHWLNNRHINLYPFVEIIPKVLENIPKSLILSVDSEEAVIIVSYMFYDNQCKEKCFPPKRFCTVTGRKKLATIDIVLDFSVDKLVDISGIMVSRQLIGGLGAILGKDLYSLLKRLENQKTPYSLAIGSACDCHGILNLYQAQS